MCMGRQVYEIGGKKVYRPHRYLFLLDLPKVFNKNKKSKIEIEIQKSFKMGK